jgi:hypothetical protein
MAALTAMGISHGGRVTARATGPECPPDMLPIFNKYKDLKFAHKVTPEAVTLIPRKAVDWSDIVAYQQVTKQNISIFEAGLIMGLDAIFEGREDG